MPGLIALAIAALLALASPPGDPAQGIETSALAASRMEIVVIEAPNCIYCSLFRRDLLPAYQASPRSRDVPLRFLDLAGLASSKLALAGAIDVVPTIVVVSQGVEVGRIPGYASKEIFFHAINCLLSPRQ